MKETNQKNLPKCWRDVENHPDMVRLIPGVEKTEHCTYRVRREVP